ncbi:MAG TPA: T9SS type A sorting domain-containing protein [Flavobacteriales bacterium]|jgi:hypothetical protein|nr:MAG: T9SS type A sorting domain-containing protein [Burkholderiaceae bacterium]HOY29364.1 T9SS type A sorting domain-containing protein [Flavobacteriales bacterium]
MRQTIFFLLALGATTHSTAQFYPNGDARWCGRDDDGSPPGYDVNYQMNADPDTLIGEQVYKRIHEYRDYELTRVYYVRSDASGKGYAYIPDSSAEYLTGDLSAQAGDTVRNVLWSNTYQSGIDYFVRDMVVNSIETLTNEGVTVERHYVRHVTDPLFHPFQFWQSGMGTTYGPMLELTGSAWACMVGDTAMYNMENDNGLPGPIGVQLCSVIDQGNVITGSDQVGGTVVHPNPSYGLFHIATPSPMLLIVCDMHGREVLHLPPYSRDIDLSLHPPGIYTVLQNTGQGRSVQRLVVVP